MESYFNHIYATKSSVIKIKIDNYRRYSNMTNLNDFSDTYTFDEECGLYYYIDPLEPKDENPLGYFRFRVIDKQKLFLGRIKYGLEYKIWRKKRKSKKKTSTEEKQCATLNL
jgi:hypothetical protein